MKTVLTSLKAFVIIVAAVAFTSCADYLSDNTNSAGNGKSELSALTPPGNPILPFPAPLVLSLK